MPAIRTLPTRYIAGQPVTRDQLTQIWEETTIVAGVWTSPIYEGFLSDVRSLNLTLPVEKRLRVLLGDPPIDWSIVRGPADEDMNDWRDAHFEWVVEEQVMKKGRRALLWIGGAHLSRRVQLSRQPDSSPGPAFSQSDDSRVVTRPAGHRGANRSGAWGVASRKGRVSAQHGIGPSRRSRRGPAAFDRNGGAEPRRRGVLGLLATR